MPGIDYSTDWLVASVKRRISLPDAQNLYTADEVIAFASDEISSTIIPFIHSIQQEYWVQRVDIPLVLNQTIYKIPIRGVGNCLRLLTLVDNNNNELQFNLLSPEQTTSTYNWLSPYTTSTLYGFNIEDDHIVMFPQSFVANPVLKLRFRIERLPNQLVSTTEAAQITAIAGNVVTTNNVPLDWVTTDRYDIINGQPAFQSKGDDLTITALNIGLSQITFAALPATVVIGDWIGVSGTSAIPQMPYQMFPYLAQATAVKCLEGLSDLEPAKIAQQKLNIMKEDLLKLLQPRDMGNVQTIVNRGGLFDNGQFWGWNGGNFW